MAHHHLNWYSLLSSRLTFVNVGYYTGAISILKQNKVYGTHEVVQSKIMVANCYYVSTESG